MSPVDAGLTPDDAQRVFRTVLAALARPGIPQRLPSLPHAASLPPALLPVLALATLDTPVALFGDEPDARWRELVRTATSAPLVEPALARLVAALRAPTPAELAELQRGSAAAPEDAVLASVAVEGVDGGEHPVQLSGPGVDGTLTVAPRGVDEPLLAARAEAVANFPTGVDIVLVAADGRVVGLPRSTRVTPAGGGGQASISAREARPTRDPTDRCGD